MIARESFELPFSLVKLGEEMSKAPILQKFREFKPMFKPNPPHHAGLWRWLVYDKDLWLKMKNTTTKTEGM